MKSLHQRLHRLRLMKKKLKLEKYSDMLAQVEERLKTLSK